MRYHLDTSFLIDGRKSSPSIVDLRDEIASGTHTVTIDPIVQTEFFAAPRIDRTYQAVYQTVLAVGALLPITPDASMLAAMWLAPMDTLQRRARFADAVVAAIAYGESASIIMNDTGMPLFPVSVLLY